MVYNPYKVDTYDLFEIILFVKFQIKPAFIGQFHSNEAIDCVIQQIIDEKKLSENNLAIFKLLREMGDTNPNNRINLTDLKLDFLNDIFNVKN
jgi:hypothetical protein